MTEINDFLEQLSSAEPVPGGGSVAALECAMGAALLAMVANLTVGRKKYAEVQERVTQIRDQASELCARAARLVDEDVAAYGEVSRVLAMPRDTDLQRTSRRAHLQSALKGAVEPPLQTMKSASQTLDLAAELVEIGNRSAVSDVGTAAGAARSGFDAALLNVEINLAAIHDEVWVQNVRSTVESFPSVAERSDAVTRRVLAIIRS